MGGHLGEVGVVASSRCPTGGAHEAVALEKVEEVEPEAGAAAGAGHAHGERHEEARQRPVPASNPPPHTHTRARARARFGKQSKRAPSNPRNVCSTQRGVRAAARRCAAGADLWRTLAGEHCTRIYRASSKRIEERRTAPKVNTYGKKSLQHQRNDSRHEGPRFLPELDGRLVAREGPGGLGGLAEEALAGPRFGLEGLDSAGCAGRGAGGSVLAL